MVNILITGSDGFIGKNFKVRLQRDKFVNALLINKTIDDNKLKEEINKSDIIFHLAGENRSSNDEDFYLNNIKLTKNICDQVEKNYRKENKKIPIVFTSTTKVSEDTLYGKSKLNCENYLKKLSRKIDLGIIIYRLTNVFGKWSKPNYNSAIATFCYNISRDLDIVIDDPKTVLNLIYIDDLVDEFLNVIKSYKQYVGINYLDIKPIYSLSLKSITEKIIEFNNSRKENYVLNVGSGFDRKLYATFLSFMQKKNFKKDLKKYSDERGSFSEIIKTSNSGQFSCFTALPGVTRGSHYHDTKSEKFVVVKGKAIFRLRCLISGEEYVTNLSSDNLEIVDSIPGWVHEIKNIGTEILIVFVWANEVFDHSRPDTHSDLNIL